MKQNRRLLYGYRYEGAGIAIEPNEATIVKEIFSKYGNGYTLKKITDWLNLDGVAYHETNPIWNKNHVHRLLQNRHYIGDDIYPCIIEPETFEQVAQVAQQRKNFQPSNNPLEPVGRNKIFCHCGTRMQCDSTNMWVCKDCGTSTTSQRILAGMQQAFQLIKTDLSVLQVDRQPEKYVPSSEVLRMNNEIRRQLSSRDIDADAVREQILQCAALKYESIEEDLTPYISRTICADFEDTEDDIVSCIPLIEKTVASMVITETARLQVKFRNGAILAVKGE